MIPTGAGAADSCVYWRYGYENASEPSEPQRALLGDVVCHGSDGEPITVEQFLKRIEQHDGVTDLVITDRYVQINTVYTNDRNEFLGLHLMRHNANEYALIDVDPFDLYAYGAWNEELDERLLEIVKKHGLTLERCAAYCLLRYDEVDRLLERFYAFWQELDALD